MEEKELVRITIKDFDDEEAEFVFNLELMEYVTEFLEKKDIEGLIEFLSKQEDTLKVSYSVTVSLDK